MGELAPIRPAPGESSTSHRGRADGQGDRRRSRPVRRGATAPSCWSSWCAPGKVPEARVDLSRVARRAALRSSGSGCSTSVSPTRTRPRASAAATSSGLRARRRSAGRSCCSRTTALLPLAARHEGSTSTVCPRRRPPPTARSSRRPGRRRRRDRVAATRRSSRARDTFIESRLPRRQASSTPRTERDRRAGDGATPCRPCFVVHLERPAVITEIAAASSAVVGNVRREPRGDPRRRLRPVLARTASCRSSCRRRRTRRDAQLAGRARATRSRRSSAFGHGLYATASPRRRP